MKYLYASLIVLHLACKGQDSREVQELRRKVDSLSSINQVKEVAPIKIQQPVQSNLFAFCVISYDYWYFDGPTFDGTSPKKHTSKEGVVTEIEIINLGEDAKAMFKDKCLANWRKSRPSYEVNHTKVTSVEVHTYSTYGLASQARGKLIY